MYKFRIFVDFDKEENWLEQMARNGYHLKSTVFGYRFESASPEDATIKIDYRTFKSKTDFVDYCAMFEDSGWKHLAGTKNSGHQYFQRKHEAAGEDIFSDDESKASRYKRFADVSLKFAMSFVPLLFIFYVTDAIDFTAFINPKALYYTPGLWDKTGMDFLFSFLFETPFALMRGFIWLVMPVTIILYIFFWYKSKKLYEEKMID